MFLIPLLFVAAFAGPECKSKLDLVLTLDGSGSISAADWKTAKQFSTNLVDAFTFGPENTRVGAVQFATTARVEFQMNANKQQVKNTINGISKMGSKTNIAAGISTAVTVLQKSPRVETVQTILLITDGSQTVAGDPIAAANQAKSKNIEIFVVAVGKEAAKFATVLTKIASEPKAKHYFQIAGFNNLKDILLQLINATCPTYSCNSITPNHGPAAGGTIVQVNGNSLSGSNPKCKFGTTIVEAVILNPTTLQCKSPPGPKGQSVVFQISLNGGASWIDQSCQFSYDEYRIDPCAQWSQSCMICISHPFCGWCSTNVTHPDGTPGVQCAGFNRTGEVPFTCVGTYHTQECTQGFTCDIQTATCKMAEPGNGVPKAECDRNCGNGMIYLCNSTNNQCQLCPAGTPGCVSHVECKADCGDPLPPVPDTPATPGTPTDLIGTIWRGLEINRKYLNGEIQLKFDNTKAYLWYPKESKLATYSVSHSGDVVVLMAQDGSVYKSRYNTQFVGQIVAMTIATGPAGGDAPSSFDAPMQDPLSDVHVFGKCLNSATCNFHWDGPAKRRTIQVEDFCMNFTTCEPCIAQPTCGWCSNDVVYLDGTRGKNCAGFNPDSSKKPFLCSGSFSSNDCVTAPKTYECEPRSKTCVESRPGFGFDFATCNATCNRPLPPAQNVTPIALQGEWRGIQIQNGYTVGEFKATFGQTNAVISKDSTVLIGGDVQSVEDQIWIQTEKGLLKGRWQIVNGPETKIIGLAFGIPGGEVPFDFGEAMTKEGYSEFFFLSCLPQKYEAGICVFDH